MRGEDYYAILGLARGATPVQIKKAYRILVLRFHPDRNPGDKKAEEQFKKIVTAYETLSHPEKRKQYDLMRNAFQEAIAQHHAAKAAGTRGAHRSRPDPAARPRRQGPPPPNASYKARKASRGRSRFELESNEFDQRDAAWGAVLGVIATAVAGTLQLGSLGLTALATLALAAAAARYAFATGVWIAERAQPHAPPALESTVRVIPSFLALITVCVVIWASRWTGTAIAVTAIGPAGMAAALAGAGGGGLGRAFTSVAVRPVALWIGALISIAVGGFAGSVLGFAFVSAGMSRLFDPAFYESMFHGALGASIGGALGSLLGALRRRKLV